MMYHNKDEWDLENEYKMQKEQEKISYKQCFIRQMIESDLNEVCRIEQESFSMPWTKKAIADSLKNENNVYLVAEYAGKIAGYCGMWGIAGEGQINHVAVTQAYRENGIASKMMKVLIEEGCKKNLTEFTLEVRESNLAAIRLYEKTGFQKEGIRKGFYDAPKENAVIMWLRICSNFH